MNKLISGLALLLAVSCSIKEDRNGCPCQLTIMPENPLELSSRLETRVTTRGISTEETIRGVYGMEEFSYGVHRVVTKDSVSVSAVSGKGLEEVGPVVGVREGNEIDSLYADAGTVDCYREAATATVHMHKQFCTLTATLDEGNWGKPSSIVVYGECNGLDIYTLQPVAGTYKATMRDGYEVRIPRQKDSDLRVVLTFDDGRSVTIPLGDYLASHGYSWTKPDLDDIDLKIDLASSTLTISIAGWDMKTFNEIII